MRGLWKVHRRSQTGRNSKGRVRVCTRVADVAVRGAGVNTATSLANLTDIFFVLATGCVTVRVERGTLRALSMR